MEFVFFLMQLFKMFYHICPVENIRIFKKVFLFYVSAYHELGTPSSHDLWRNRTVFFHP